MHRLQGGYGFLKGAKQRLQSHGQTAVNKLYLLQVSLLLKEAEEKLNIRHTEQETAGGKGEEAMLLVSQLRANLS